MFTIPPPSPPSPPLTLGCAEQVRVGRNELLEAGLDQRQRLAQHRRRRAVQRLALGRDRPELLRLQSLGREGRAGGRETAREGGNGILRVVRAVRQESGGADHGGRNSGSFSVGKRGAVPQARFMTNEIASSRPRVNALLLLCIGFGSVGSVGLVFTNPLSCLLIRNARIAAYHHAPPRCTRTWMMTASRRCLPFMTAGPFLCGR